MIKVTEAALREWLPRQRWFGHKDHPISAVHLSDPQVLRDEWPLLVRFIGTVELDSRSVDYQLLLGARPTGDVAEFLHGHDEAVVGAVDTDAGEGFAYDASLDAALGACLLSRILPDEEVRHVRPLGAEQSNTSLVFDDRIVLKLFRQLSPGPNPDIEVTTRLADVGFEHVAAPLGVEEEGEFQLALAQEFLVGGADGWQLALTSLRDLFALHDTQQMRVIDPSAPRPDPVTPGQAGGDFAAEAERLGAITADLHVAMADAFGRDEADLDAWAAPMRAQLARTRHPDVDESKVRGLLDRLGSVRRPGPAVRIHGDYHLGQVLRTDTGWYVLDFEGEPARPLAERAATSSPLKDVAGMLRSFHYASQVALRDRGQDGALVDVATQWERRNRQAFLDGYLPRADDAGLLPGDASGWTAVLAAFELDKAVYELAYEMSHRPEWVAIPLAAITRILEG